MPLKPGLRWNRLSRRHVVLAVLAGLSVAALPAIERRAQLAAQSRDETGKKLQAERLQEMKRRVNEIRVTIRQQEKEIDVKPAAEPALRFNDPAREFHDGTIWAMGKGGRPAALVTLEKYPSLWAYELISLSTDEISAVLADGRRWAPAKPGIEWVPIPTAPAPAATEAARLAQMKTLARRFVVRETGKQDDHYELRLLPQPIHRYADAAAGLTDGAIFVFAYGTNPEAVLVMESRRQGAAEPAWFFAFAPLSANQVSAQLDGREVWNKPITSNSMLRDPYFNFGD